MTITSETVNLDQLKCRKINSHREIYTTYNYLVQNLKPKHQSLLFERSSLCLPYPLLENKIACPKLFLRKSKIACIFKLLLWLNHMLWPGPLLER